MNYFILYMNNNDNDCSNSAYLVYYLVTEKDNWWTISDALDRSVFNHQSTVKNYVDDLYSLNLLEKRKRNTKNSGVDPYEYKFKY